MFILPFEYYIKCDENIDRYYYYIPMANHDTREIKVGKWVLALKEILRTWNFIRFFS